MLALLYCALRLGQELCRESGEREPPLAPRDARADVEM
jgi:hypothetical protein